MIHDTAAIVVVKDGKVLLIKRLNEPDMGYWAIPGGHMDEGETPGQAAAREASEEIAGVRVVGAHIFVFEHDVGEGEKDFPERHKHRCYCFSGDAAGKISTGSDAGEYGWFTFGDALKERITSSSRTVVEWLMDKKDKQSTALMNRPALEEKTSI